MPENADLSDKATLRRVLRAARKAHVGTLSARDCYAAAAALADLALPQLAGARIVAVYCQHGFEIDPVLLRDRLAAAGATIVYPRVEPATETLSFHVCGDGELIAGYRGLVEPPVDAPALRPDVVLVPLVGADAQGNRIGQGGGHYDRTLAQLRGSGHNVRAIGLAWEVQIIDAIAADTWDQRLDALATPERWIDCAD